MRAGSGNRVAYNVIVEALDRIRPDPELDIELVEEEDDVCALCRYMAEEGCGRGADHVRDAEALNDRVVKAIGLRHGTVMKAKLLFKLTIKAIPEPIPVMGEDYFDGPEEDAEATKLYRLGVQKGLWEKA
jgi:hypothetical protein